MDIKKKLNTFTFTVSSHCVVLSSATLKEQSVAIEPCSVMLWDRVTEMLWLGPCCR